MKKRLIAMLLASVMCLTALAGCGGSSSTGDSPTVMKVNEEEVPASELAAYIFYTMSYYQNYFGMDSSYFTDETMFNELKQSAADQIVSLRAVKAMANDLNVSLTDEDKKELEEVKKTNMEYLGAQTSSFKRWIAYTVKGKDDPWETYLNSMGYTEELYDQDCEIMKLEDGMTDYYFDNGEITKRFNDEYLHAKSILIKDTDEDGNALKGAEKKAAKKKAQEILDKLENGEDFDTLFKENNDDTAQGDDGYYFVDGEMVQPYTEAVQELEDNEITKDLVYYEGYGWFIIKRLPLDEAALDDPESYLNNQGDDDESTIKSAIGETIINENLSDYQEKAEVEYTDEYDKITVYNVNTYLGFVCDPLISTEGSGSVADGSAGGSAQ